MKRELAPAAAPWAVAAVVLAFYSRVLGRSFTSEDFLLVRFLGENPPWRHLRSLFTSPWLEISVVKFYRPVSTLLYGSEIAAFGGNPVGINVVHVLVHALNAVLVWAIARRLVGKAAEGEDRDEVTPRAAALLFAVYPLHPNAVIFGASFATLFAATFLFAALLAWQRFRESGSRWSQALALGSFALALGSYEAAVVFPFVIAAHDHLLCRRPHLALLPDYIPFFLLGGLYFWLRKSLFGVFVGGYEEQGHSLLSPRIGPLLHDLATSILRLHVPVYERWPGPGELAIGCALLIGLPLVLFWWHRGPLRIWLFAWIWTLAALAPFAFRPSVPANGRYWYLAAAGAALSLSFAVRAGSRERWLPSVALGLVGLFWSVLLFRSLTVYREAGETARTIQEDLVRTAEPGGPAKRFLTGHPDFLKNESGVPIAQVLRYGVWDAVHPPFVRSAVEVYPLPPLQGLDLLPVVRGAPGSRIDAWDPRLREVRRIVPSFAGALPAELPVIGPPEGAAIDTAHDLAAVTVPTGFQAAFRLIVISRGNPAVVEVGQEALKDGILRAPFPDDFCRTMDRLYGGEQLWWIEARDAAGVLSAFTPMRSFKVVR
jgi:hypothetical protein